MIKKILIGTLVVSGLAYFGLTRNICCPIPESNTITAEKASPTITKTTFHVNGMTCGACSTAINIALKKLNGVKSANVSYENSTATVEYNSEKVASIQIIEVIEKLGYKASLTTR